MEDNKLLYYCNYLFINYSLNAVNSEDYIMSNEERSGNNELQTILKPVIVLQGMNKTMTKSISMLRFKPKYQAGMLTT
jgi:hypothetical protein